MHGFPRGKTAIVGAATFGVGKAPGFEAIDLAAHASLLALAEAGLTPADVDALFIAQPQDTLAGLTFAEYLGIQPKITDNNRTGGSAFLLHLAHAALALDAGLCDVALIAYGSNQATAAGELVSTSRSSAYEAPYKPLRPISSYALAAARHMHQYGTTKRQLAEVAVAARRWAQLNPEAWSRDELIAGRRRQRAPGVRPARRARLLPRHRRRRGDRDDARRPRRAICAHAPVYVLGAASAVTHADISSMPDLTVTGAAQSGARAYAQAGVRPPTSTCVQLYDAFTINTILFLEDLGFCAEGRRRRVRRRRPHRARRRVAGQHQRRRPVVLPPRACTACSRSSSRCASCAATRATRQVRRREARARARQRRRAVEPGDRDLRHRRHALSTPTYRSPSPRVSTRPRQLRPAVHRDAAARAEAPPVTLDDEIAQYRVLPHEHTDLWEETAFALVAESGDHDVLMWTAGYLLKGNGRGVWIDKQAAEHDIMFIAVPKANRGTMSDNHFVRSRLAPHRATRSSQGGCRPAKGRTFDRTMLVKDERFYGPVY